MAIINGTAVNGYGNLLGEIKERIRSAQYEALRAINKELIGLYWDIGRMIVERLENGKRGRAIVKKLAEDLQAEFPGIQGFSASNLWRMRVFYESYTENRKLAPLAREIGWTQNYIILEKAKDDLKREFYIRMTRKFGWTKNVLIHHIDNQTYEKTLLNQVNFDKTLPKKLRNQAKLAVRDEYTFDFLELGEEHGEREFERAIVARVERFMREMGGLFHFVGSQHRLEISGDEFFIDILLYHRVLRSYVGVAAYRMVSSLPEELTGQLPAPAQVALLMEEV
jgi:predicted nuclease of restriction endonuclease-like (RecB) superfamily